MDTRTTSRAQEGPVPLDPAKDSVAEDTGEIERNKEGEQENESKDKSADFDEGTSHTAVFCLTQVPDEYLQTLFKSAKDKGVDLLEITSNSPTSNLSDIKANLSTHPRPHPFLNDSIPDIYTFFKSHLRPDIDHVGKGMHFTTFTFLCIDPPCLTADPWEIQLCTDAPDFGESGEGEDEVVLKTLRLPIDTALEHLDAVEMLLMTPSTVGHPSGLSLSIQPAAWLAPTERPGLFKVATARQARANKARAIAGLGGSADEVLGTGAGG